jgi:hypothetical protein
MQLRLTQSQQALQNPNVKAAVIYDLQFFLCGAVVLQSIQEPPTVFFWQPLGKSWEGGSRTILLAKRGGLPSDFLWHLLGKAVRVVFSV